MLLYKTNTIVARILIKLTNLIAATYLLCLNGSSCDSQQAFYMPIVPTPHGAAGRCQRALRCWQNDGSVAVLLLITRPFRCVCLSKPGSPCSLRKTRTRCRSSRVPWETLAVYNCQAEAD